MDEPRFLLDRASAVDAARLIAAYGVSAGAAAAARADDSRDRGNVLHFCRWRQIERFIEALHGERGEATVH